MTNIHIKKYLNHFTLSDLSRIILMFVYSYLWFVRNIKVLFSYDFPEECSQYNFRIYLINKKISKSSVTFCILHYKLVKNITYVLSRSENYKR